MYVYIHVGSDFTWTQCAPCTKSCYKQKDPVFDPSESSTYSNITCSSTLCTEVRSATSAPPGCSSTTCIYGIQYGDSSFSVGFFAKDTLSLGSHDIVQDFYFGCGENNQGLFGGSAGLMGLGRNQLSVISQCATKYGKVFSYCLPSKSSSTGHLTFGKGGTVCSFYSIHLNTQSFAINLSQSILSEISQNSNWEAIGIVYLI